MAVAVAKIEMAGADFGTDDQGPRRVAGADHVGGGLHAEGRRGARDVHVEAEAGAAQRILDLDGDGRIGALQVRAGHEDAVDFLCGAARLVQRLARCVHAHLGEQRELLVRTLRDARAHDVGVQNARLVHDVAGLDAGGLDDELDAGLGKGLDRAIGNGIGVGGVELLHVGVEGCDQFLVADGVWRGEKPRPADCDCRHVNPRRR